MGLNVNYINTSAQSKSVIDSEALERVKQKILNPDNSINTSSIDLSKFNRASLGTDLYASRTNGETALQAAKAATDFDINFSETFNSNVQYLKSQAAQSLFTNKENNGIAAISIENTQTVNEEEIITAAVQISETSDMKNDKRGSNPFSFYMPSETDEKSEEDDLDFNSINIFA